MTLEEKRNKLRDHCRHTNCDKCKLRGGDWSQPSIENCLIISISPETDVDKAIAIIDGTLTLEEKREKIKRFCESRAGCVSPDKCPLYDTVATECYSDTDVIEEHYEILFGDKAEKTEGRPYYWAEVCKIQKRQTEKGVAKYGRRLEDNHELTMIERLEYLEEELIDGLMYIEHIKAAIREGAV